MAVQLVPGLSIVPIIKRTPDLLVKAQLGTGFFVGNQASLHLITAKHVFTGNPIEGPESYSIVFNNGGTTMVSPIQTVIAAAGFDLAVCTLAREHVPGAVPLDIADANPPLSNDILTYEYSSTRIEKTATGTHVAFEPYTHKGNVVRIYDSTFPEALPTPSFLTSFPALQGASGAPLIDMDREKKRLAVVGMLVANFERHLIPAQVVTIEDGPSYKETTSYYMPFGKALSWSVIRKCLTELGIPFSPSGDEPNEQQAATRVTEP